MAKKFTKGLSRILARILAVGLIGLFSLTPAHSEIHQGWATLAYDQAVLAHRMTKSACLVMLGFDANAYLVDVQRSSEHFLAQNKELATLPDNSNVSSAQWQEIQQTVEELARYFDPMVRSAQQISAGDMHSVAVRILLDRNANASDEFISLAAHSPQEIFNKPLAHSMFFVMQQRVLSQQMLRDLCFVRAGFGGQDTRARLVANIAEFAEITQALIDGDDQRHISKAANIYVELKLKSVQQRWKDLSRLIENALQADELAKNDIRLVSIMGDAVLTALDQVLIELRKL